MNEEFLLNKLKEIFSEVLNIEASMINKLTKQSDVESWDSFGHLRLMMAIEQKIGVSFPMEEIASFSSIEDIMNAILSKIK